MDMDMDTDTDLIVVDTERAMDILEAEKSWTELQNLLASLKLVPGPDFSPMGSILFTELGASSPYYVPFDQRLSSSQIPERDPTGSWIEYRHIIEALYKTVSSFNLRLIESLASLKREERKLIRDATMTEVLVKSRGTSEYANGHLGNQVLDRFWWANMPLDTTEDAVMQHGGFGLRINSNPPPNMKLAVDIQRHWSTTIAKFVDAWCKTKKNEMKAIEANKTRRLTASGSSSLTIRDLLAGATSLSPLDPQGAGAGAFLDSSRPLVQQFMQAGKDKGLAAYLTCVEKNFFQAALGLLALLLVSSHVPCSCYMCNGLTVYSPRCQRSGEEEALTFTPVLADGNKPVPASLGQLLLSVSLSLLGLSVIRAHLV